jgi:GntR family transcriptional regulator/MocR family aminotransferase
MAPAVRAGQPFVARLPDTAAFDLKAWRASVARAARALEPAMLHAPDPRGLPALREAICRHLALTRGVACTPAQVLVVTGIRHAIDLCAQAVAGHGGPVAIEDPGYPGAAQLFALRGCLTLPIPVDGQGMDVAALRRTAARVAYLTPAHQAPTGVVLSPPRRAELLQWACDTGATLIEDDYDSDFSYETAPPPALKSQDHTGSVIFCGSFNKSMFPALRIGYIVAPPVHLDALTRLRAATGRANAVLDQLALADFMRTSAFTRHLQRTRLRHQQRRDLVLAELRAAGLPGDLCQGLHAGFHFVLRLPEGVTEDTAIAHAAEQGITLQGLAAFRHGSQPPPPPALLIGYTALTDAQARWNARRLAELLKQLQQER